MLNVESSIAFFSLIGERKVGKWERRKGEEGVQSMRAKSQISVDSCIQESRLVFLSFFTRTRIKVKEWRLY